MRRRYYNIDLELASNASIATQKQQIDKSDEDMYLGVAINPTPVSDAIKIEIKQNGNRIMDAIPVKFCDNQIGPVEHRFLQIPTKGNASLEVVATSVKPTTQAYSIQATFVGTKNEVCN